MENRNGFVVDACLRRATGTAEPEAARAMLKALPEAGHKTVGADKAYDIAAFVANSRTVGVTPHEAQNINAHRGSNIDARTTGTPAIGSASSSASGSRRRMAGSRRSPAWHKPS